MYIYIFFRAQICESPSYYNHIYWYIYIYMPCTVSRAAIPSPSLSSNHPLELPSEVDGNNLTKLVRLSYNDWSLCSASVNQIQSLCPFSKKSWAGSSFTFHSFCCKDPSSLRGRRLCVAILQPGPIMPHLLSKLEAVHVPISSRNPLIAWCSRRTRDPVKVCECIDSLFMSVHTASVVSYTLKSDHALPLLSS